MRDYITTRGVEWWLDNIEPYKSAGGFAHFKYLVELNFPDEELGKLYRNPRTGKPNSRQTISGWRKSAGLIKGQINA